MGKITKQWSGLAKEYFTDADNFGIQCECASVGWILVHVSHTPQSCTAAFAVRSTKKKNNRVSTLDVMRVNSTLTMARIAPALEFDHHGNSMGGRIHCTLFMLLLAVYAYFLHQLAHPDAELSPFPGQLYRSATQRKRTFQFVSTCLQSLWVLASFPGPSQFPVTCSMVQRERAWYISSHE